MTILWDKTVLIFADLFPDWELENWQIVMQMNLITKLLEHLTLRRLMSYIYGAPILDVSRSQTTTQHSR